MSRPTKFTPKRLLVSCLGLLLFSYLPTQAANDRNFAGAAAQTLAQPLLAAFQHSILSSRALGAQSKQSLSCVESLPKDSFSEMIQVALQQRLSRADLTAIDAYFSRPAFAAQIPQLLAYLQGLPLAAATDAPRPAMSAEDRKLEADLQSRDILNKLMLAEYFKTPQVIEAFSAKSKDLLAQCAIRQNEARDPLRAVA
ncbi:hypothetical protein [Undibacterium sp. Ren11W]|uniref:hypothetical protein n=1 Tax=Undibacterium sp. Ren11W TaxID=3413045 RepID=UPI003BF04354